jgi:hypothetical protein
MKKIIFYLSFLIMLSNATLGQSIEFNATPLMPASTYKTIRQEQGFKAGLTYSTEKKVSFIIGADLSFLRYSIQSKITDNYGNYAYTQTRDLNSMYLGFPIGARWNIKKCLLNPYVQCTLNNSFKVSGKNNIEAAACLIGSSLESGVRFSISDHFKIGAGLGYTRQFIDTYSQIGGANGSSFDVSIRVTYKIK